jgi:ABC-type lipoprotein export system ATPase subunit
MVTKNLESEAVKNQDSAGKPVVRLVDVVKTYKTGEHEFTALKGVTAEFYPGTFAGVLGKSGAGKSTLVNMITGVDTITKGEIYVDDVPVHTLNENQMALWRGQNIGVIYQTFQLLPMLSLLDNVMLPIDFCGNYHPRRSRERAMELLTMVELEDHVRKLPSAISGGQQQRVAIARALANDPPIIVADEPTGSLDSVTAEIIFQIFEKLVERGKTIIMVTHDFSLAHRMSHSIYMADGEIISPHVAGNMTMLNSQQMLMMTHAHETRVYQPGEMIIQQNEVVDGFFIIASGKVEVIALKKKKKDVEVLIERLGAGEYLGILGLVNHNDPEQSEPSLVGVRVMDETPLEVVFVPYDVMGELMEDSEELNDTLRVLAHKRQEKIQALV